MAVVAQIIPKAVFSPFGRYNAISGLFPAGAGDGFAAPLLLTNLDFRFIATEQMAEIGIAPGPILIEPDGRNIAPAVLAAALWLTNTDPDALMLVAPSDHAMLDSAAFRQAVRAGVPAGVPAAQAGQFVTFGIKPDHP